MKDAGKCAVGVKSTGQSSVFVERKTSFSSNEKHLSLLDQLLLPLVCATNIWFGAITRPILIATYIFDNMHGLALQQVQALRAVCLLFSPLLLMTAVLVMGTLGGWIFRVAVASTSASVASTGVSSSLSTYPCAVLSYAFGLASPACFDIASNSEEEQRQLLLNVPHSNNNNNNNNNNSNMFLHLHSAISTTAAFVQNAADQQQHQGAALLSPSLLSLLVGVIGPCILFLFLQYQIWRGELRLEDEFLGIFRTGSRSRSTHDSSSGGIKNEKRRREILEIRLKDYTHAVQTSDVVRPPCPRSRKHSYCGGDNRSICVGDIDPPEQHDFRGCGECCQSVVLVPTPGQRSTCSAGGGCSTGTSLTWTHDNGPKREVPNLCCICLTDYQSGQEIAWSSNRSCRHVFHKSCLMPWLIKTQHCPVCRQSFLVSSDVH